MKTFFTFLFLSSPFFLLSQHVTLDQNFANNGVYSHLESDDAEIVDTKVLTDGRVLLLGNTAFDPDEGDHTRIILIMLTKTGELDNSFGKKYIDTPLFSDYAHALIVLEDDKILIAGYTSSTTTFTGTLYKLNSNGSLDTGFGNGGRAFIPNEFTEFRNLAVQSSDKRIVVSGNGLLSSRNAYLVARFNSSGTLDNTFNNKGFNLFRTSPNNTEEDDNGGWGLDIQQDGKIISCGTDENENGVIVRLNADGKLDSSFGPSGIRTTESLDPDNGNGVGYYFFSIEQVNDKVVIGGNRQTNNLGVIRYQACIFRLLNNGNSDKTISDTGMKAYGIKYEYAFENNINIQQNGQYIMNFNNSLCRINSSDGSLDKGFDGDDGIYVYSDYSTNFLGVHLDGPYIYTYGHTLNSSLYSGKVFRFINSTLSNISDDVLSETIKIYPTITNDEVTINSVSEITKIQVFTTLGILVEEQHVNSGIDSSISLADLSQGTYIISVVTKDKIRITRQIVKL